MAAALFACTPAHPTVTITIGADALDTARAVAATDHADFAIAEIDHDVAIVTIDARELEALTEAMHAEHHRCGGYIVEDSPAAARAHLAQTHAVMSGVDPGTRVDYTLDRAAAVAEVLPAIDAAQIKGTIGELQAMKNRYYESPSGVAMSTWLAERWRAIAAGRGDIAIRLVGDKVQKTVVLEIPGTTKRDEVVVIGGHLDSITWPKRGDTRAPGADDDASGIATETEVLRALLARDFHPARTVQFVGYAAEEVGLRGSQALVADYQRRGVKVVGALQLDMTNYRGSDKDIWLMKDFTSAAQNAFLASLIETYVHASYGYDACGYACSDHASWFRAGVPASMPFESRTRQYNPRIHTADDTLEISDNNATHAHTFARLAAAYALELAKGELGTHKSI